MGFQVIEPRSRSGAPVRISVRNYASGHVLAITVSNFLATELGWSNRQHVEVSRGSGPDAGWVRLRAGERGHKLRPATAKGADWLLVVKAWDGLPSQHPNVVPEAKPDPITKSLLIKLPFAAGAR